MLLNVSLKATLILFPMSSDVSQRRPVHLITNTTLKRSPFLSNLETGVVIDLVHAFRSISVEMQYASAVEAR